MKEKGKGGANTQTGLKFEKKTDILSVISKLKGYTVQHSHTILFNGKEVAKSFKKNALYKHLEENKVDYKNILSKRLLPDEAIFVLSDKKLFVIEMKFQKVAGSVDEKLQTCDFKKKQYKKLMAPLNVDVEYIYVLSDWFRNPSYKDTLDYILSVGCQYYFEVLPLKHLGLPTSV